MVRLRELLKTEKNHHTGFAFVLASTKLKDHTIFTYRGARKYLSISASEIKKLKTKWVYITSLNQKSWKKDLNNIILNKNFNICWNPGNKQIEDGRAMKRFLKNIDVLYINKSEAFDLIYNITQKKPDNHSTKGMLKKIFEFGPKIVIITSGKKGADSYDGKVYIHQNIIPSKREDTTGLGDSFGSCLVSGLVYGKSLKTAMKMGAINSSSVVSKVGAQNGILKYSQVIKKI